MAPKRRGPTSPNTDNLVIQQRKQHATERARQYRSRKKAAKAVNTLVTEEQLQQGEVIVDLGFTDETAVPTPPQLGLRVSEDIRLPEDPRNSLLFTMEP
jgi:hypothetical protein